MNRIEDITNCHVCGGNNMIPQAGVPIPDIMTDEEVKRDILFCVDCETSHYIDDGTIAYEFSYKIGQTIGEKVRK
jgi:hypothetical protein